MGKTMAEAQASAWNAALFTLGMSKTTEIKTSLEDIQKRIDGQSEEQITSVTQADGYVYNGGQKLFKVLISESSGRPCGSSDSYRHYLLVCPGFGNCGCKIQFPGDIPAAVRSTILPGWGQVYKGRTSRGVSFMAGVGVLAASSGLSFVFSQQNASRAADARTLNTKDYYNSLRDRSWYLSITLGTAAVATWVWNVYDAKNCQGNPRFSAS